MESLPKALQQISGRTYRVLCSPPLIPEVTDVAYEIQNSKHIIASWIGR